MLAPARRIVSLLPSATEIVCALGLADRLVGISHSCDYPPSVTDRPRLTRPRRNLDGLSSGEIDAAVRAALHEDGSVYEIDLDGIRALAPDLVLTQGICDVCAVPESQVLNSLVPTLKSGPSESLRLKRSAVMGPLFRVGTQVLRLDAHDLSAICTSIRDVGCATGAVAQAEDCVANMQRRIEAVRARTAGRPRPRVLALEWLDPPYVPGHWVPEMIDIAGGELVAGITRRPSYRMEWSQLRELEPEIVLIMPCGFNLDETRREAERHRSELQAIGGRVHVLDASAYFSRSGPRVVDGLEILASTFAALRRRSISPPPLSPPPYISCVSLVSTPAVVLRTYRYSETSKIVRLATRDYGVQSAIAKGVLRPRSPFGAALETLSEGVAQLYHKETRELQTLAAFDVVQLRRDLADDLGRFAGAAALSEVMLKMAPPAPLPAAYQAFLQGLDALVRAEPGQADAAAVRWLWLLVGVLGFAPQLETCVRDGNAVSGTVAFSVAEGGVLCAKCAGLQPPTKLPPQAYRDLVALNDEQAELPALDAAHAAAHRRLIARFVRHHLDEAGGNGREPKSTAIDIWERRAWGLGS